MTWKRNCWHWLRRIEEQRGVVLTLAHGHRPMWHHRILTCMQPLHSQPTQLGIASMPLASPASHDTATFTVAGVPSAMLFVRNANGSHNPYEAMEIDDFLEAAAVMTGWLVEAVRGDRPTLLNAGFAVSDRMLPILLGQVRVGSMWRLTSRRGHRARCSGGRCTRALSMSPRCRCGACHSHIARCQSVRWAAGFHIADVPAWIDFRRRRQRQSGSPEDLAGGVSAFLNTR